MSFAAILARLTCSGGCKLPSPASRLAQRKTAQSPYLSAPSSLCSPHTAVICFSPNKKGEKRPNKADAPLFSMIDMPLAPTDLDSPDKLMALAEQMAENPAVVTGMGHILQQLIPLHEAIAALAPGANDEILFGPTYFDHDADNRSKMIVDIAAVLADHEPDSPWVTTLNIMALSQQTTLPTGETLLNAIIQARKQLKRAYKSLGGDEDYNQLMQCDLLSQTPPQASRRYSI